jgi:hypothetical protein
MTANAFENLIEMTDRLRPNMWLKLDWVAFERCFDADPNSKVAREAAVAFAENNNLVVHFDDLNQFVELGRPYFNRDNDA